MNATDLPPTLTVRDAAGILGCSTSALYDAIKADEAPVPFLRIGRKIVIPTRPMLELLGMATTADPAEQYVPALSVIDGGAER